MKILVLSDSHSGISFMRCCLEKIKPDAVVHLGDHYDDGEAMAQAYSHIPFHLVAGNCDRYRAPVSAREMLCYRVCGVMLYLTHGHRHNVKITTWSLLSDARAAGAAAVLYGHTHVADCHREEDGLWVLNPGSCGSWGGSVGLIETVNNEISTCRILRQADIEAL